MSYKMMKTSLVIVLLISVARCQRFNLDLSPSSINTQITQNVTLKCYPEVSNSIDGSCLSMRILKEDVAPHWHVVAEMEANKPGVTVHETNVVTSGRIGNLDDSYLTVTWPLAAVDILGRYRCDIIGFNLNQDIIQEKTREIVISARNVTLQDVLELVKEVREDTNRRYAEIMMKFVNIENQQTNGTQIKLDEFMEVAGNINNFTQETKQELLLLTERIDQIKLNFTVLLDPLSASISRLWGQMFYIFDTGIRQFWPQGNYGLMATSSGCPADDGSLWRTGSFRHHTESSDANHDQVSANNHLQQPVMEKLNNQNFMYQHFCISDRETNFNYIWPRGSYCINMYGSECPRNFFLSYVMWTSDKNKTSSSSENGTLPSGVYDIFHIVIYFCCRSDSQAYIPIYLPVSKPFYLYRYQGVCQAVDGMSVQEEFILFDTENTDNSDMFGHLDVHPDGQANNDVRLELCYYTPN